MDISVILLASPGVKDAFAEGILPILVPDDDIEEKDDDIEENDDAFMLALIMEEIAKIENISKASLKDLDGDQTIVLCCYNANNSEFEFYFKHHEDMASIVGIGLEYARTIFMKGWEVKVEEIFEEDWVKAWKEIESNTSTMCKLLKLEPCLQNQKEKMISKEKVSPKLLVWELAKYFTLKKSFEKLCIAIATKGVKYTTTLRGSNSKSQSSSGSDNNESNLEGGFLRWFGNWQGTNYRNMKQNHKNGKDKEDNHEGDDKKGKSLENLGPRDIIDNDEDTKVLQSNLFNMTSFGNKKSVALSRCRIIDNMTIWTKVSYYQGLVIIHHFQCQKVLNTHL